MFTRRAEANGSEFLENTHIVLDNIFYQWVHQYLGGNQEWKRYKNSQNKHALRYVFILGFNIFSNDGTSLSEILDTSQVNIDSIIFDNIKKKFFDKKSTGAKRREYNCFLILI